MTTRACIGLVIAIHASACHKTEPPATTTPPSAAATPSASAAPALAAADTVPTASGELTIVPLRHATLLFEWAGNAIYVDPAADASYDGLPKADVILVTDIHADHMSPPTIASLRKPAATIVVPAAVAPNLPPDGVVTIANGESKTIAGLGVLAVPMYNLVRGPSAGKLYHDKGRGNGYVLTFADKRVYLSGDTECTPEMKALKNIDIAFVCMNLPYTMPPSEAAACIKAFRPKAVYPYHYRGSNLDELVATVTHEGIDVRLRNWYP